MIAYSFVGADPVGLVGMADSADQYASRLEMATVEVMSAAARSGAAIDVIDTCLLDTSRWLGEQVPSLRWRANAIDAAQRVAIPHFLGRNRELTRMADFAALAVFDLNYWEEAYLTWRAAPHPSQLLKMDPAQVAAAFGELAPATAENLARRYPRIIGSLDGAPPRLRYLANDLLLEAEIARLEHGMFMLEYPQSAQDLKALGVNGTGRGPVAAALIAAVTSALAGRAAEYRRWVDEDRQILLFDPSGDGRVVEVFGDLDPATHLAVVVPGMANSIENFSSSEGGFRDNAASLHEAASGNLPVATVAWLGYDSPDNIGAIVTSAASDGAPALSRLLEGIGAQKTVTVVAHSYGSVLAGTAARTGIAADNLVFVGSPGTTLDHADEAVLRPGGRVWSALADGDPISWGVAPQELPIWEFLANPFVAVVGLSGFFDRPTALWHGTNPAEEGFGAARIDTQGSSGHSSYFEANSLENLALIVEGDYPAVELVP
jgi:pimeloyl-ACP methyl ester carboxylesterase